MTESLSGSGSPTTQALIDRQDLLWEDAQRAFRALIGEIEAAGGQKGWMQEVWHQAWHRHVPWLRCLKALERYCENQHTMALAHIVAERAAADALRSLPPTCADCERMSDEVDRIIARNDELAAEVARLTQARDPRELTSEMREYIAAFLLLHPAESLTYDDVFAMVTKVLNWGPLPSPQEAR